MKAVLIITFMFGGLVGEVQSFHPVPDLAQCNIAREAMLKNPPSLARNGDFLDYNKMEAECKFITEVFNK